jgi:1-acyl-sn-glycerol-3-phosphate acyltransferase
MHPLGSLGTNSVQTATIDREDDAVRVSGMYRVVMLLVTPILRWWGRLEVVGLELLPASGPTVVIGNHDSNWDPLVVGVAAMHRRPIRAMAKAQLWGRSRALAWVMSQMGQLKITRGRADLSELMAVRRALAAGDCVGVFPEGKLSRGHKLRAFSGAGWLAKSDSAPTVLAVTMTGAVDLVRFPKRPRIQVTFFEPLSGQRRPGESSIGLSRRVLAEIRDRVPPVAAGRHA